MVVFKKAGSWKNSWMGKGWEWLVHPKTLDDVIRDVVQAKSETWATDIDGRPMIVWGNDKQVIKRTKPCVTLGLEFRILTFASSSVLQNCSFPAKPDWCSGRLALPQLLVADFTWQPGALPRPWCSQTAHPEVPWFAPNGVRDCSVLPSSN